MIFEQNPKDQEKRNVSLMLVCKLWRKIVLGSPRLWNTIVLILESIGIVCSQWRYTVACLERSGHLPLNIYIDAKTFIGPTLPIEPAMDLFEEITHDYPPNDTLGSTTFDTNLLMDSNYDILSAIFSMTVTILCGPRHRFVSRWNSILTSEVYG
jgi:hypothetical protein